jgi:drug/metabolite transporter (DMT)-like permease
LNGSIFAMVLASAVLHATYNFTARKVVGNLSAISLSIALGALALSPIVVPKLSHGPALGSHWTLIVASGLGQACYLIVLARAYSLGEISVVYPIARGTGITGIALASRLFLGEPISILGAAGIACVIAGILLIGLGQAKRDGRRSAAHALVLGGIMTSYSLVDKRAMAGVVPIVYVCTTFWVACAVLGPWIWLRRRQELRGAWSAHRKAIVLMAGAASGTYTLILTAVASGPLGYISAAREVAVVIASALGIVVLKESLSVRKAAGIAAILAGLALIRLA